MIKRLLAGVLLAALIVFSANALVIAAPYGTGSYSSCQYQDCDEYTSSSGSPVLSEAATIDEQSQDTSTDETNQTVTDSSKSLGVIPDSTSQAVRDNWLWVVVTALFIPFALLFVLLRRRRQNN